jgi:predicted transcriptional regulator
MAVSELDSVLNTVENPVRRKIIEKLSREPSYQLQLSKDLGLSQQLVAKHLVSMEDAGLVRTVIEESPRGPKRKEYILSKSVSVTVDFAPNLFRARVFTFGAVPGIEENSENQRIFEKINEILRYPDEVSRIGPLAQIILEVDNKLKKMEEERAVLLYLRSLALKEAARASSSLKSSDRKKVLHYILSEQKESIMDMSYTLGIHRQVLSDIIEEIEKEFFHEE